MTLPTNRVRLETTEGDIIVELWPDVAPRHAQNFQQLVHDGFYDGLKFHRIVPGFIIQSGCGVGDGTGNPGWTIDAEFNDRPHEKGTVSMARTANPNSAGSQFFICLTRENCQHLDGEYTAFGQVVEGLDVVDRIAESPLSNPQFGTPIDPPRINHAHEIYTPPDPGHPTSADPAPPQAPQAPEAPEAPETPGTPPDTARDAPSAADTPADRPEPDQPDPSRKNMAD